jgi:diaminopimelate epimerase
MSPPSTCWRVSGGGNDFLALIEPPAVPDASTIRAWCRRGLSLGADGLFVLSRQGEAVRMDYWNADGSPADLCINGTRCAARLAFDLGWANGTMTIATGAGPIAAAAAGEDRIALALPPAQAPPVPRRLAAAGREWSGWQVSVGVPHFVVPWEENLGQAPVAELGPALRHHPDLGPAGANVDFVRFRPPRRLEIRTFERGVEAETLACGTGVLAAAATALELGALGLPLRALTLGGFELEVEGELREDRLVSWRLLGDARLLGRCEILPGAARLPDPPAWSP